MNLTMQLAVVVAVCLCLAEGAPDGRLARKQQRPTRGFKNVEMMTARGFGKRDRSHTRAERDVDHQQSSQRPSRGTPTFKSPSVGIARDFGKRTPEFENEDDIGYVHHPRMKFTPKIGLMVAHDFGKRSGNDDYDEEEEIRVTRGTFKPNSNILIARGYGKRTNSQNEPVYGVNNYWDMLENAPEREGQEANDDKTLESIPLDWFVNEILNNPDFARSVVRKFIDLNQDGMLSSDELLRNY
ncbi:allatotropin-like [Bombyx mandarina]|uniref:Allatotropin-like n=1 Tax=Bombyx mandarina TaxID=7092 RepID=A0A6J2JIQ0_BOMMA|nr:allatotropin-like [Bombyx mandarina]